MFDVCQRLGPVMFILYRIGFGVSMKSYKVIGWTLLNFDFIFLYTSTLHMEKHSYHYNEHHGTKLTNAATQVYCRKPWRLSALFHCHVTPFEKKKNNKNLEIKNLHAEKISHSSVRILCSSKIQASWYSNPDLCDTGVSALTSLVLASQLGAGNKNIEHNEKQYRAW